jgi:hypothetical protein
VTIPDRLSDAALRASSQVADGSGPDATLACIDSWLTDFRADLPKIDIPVLAVHGTADRVLPFEVTAARLRDERLIADLTVVEIAEGPHNVGWIHPEEVNSAFLSFLSSEARDRRHRWRQPGNRADRRRLAQRDRLVGQVLRRDRALCRAGLGQIASVMAVPAP